MSSRCSWAAGIIIIIAWVSGRPASTSSSSTRSKAAESELPSGISGRQRSRSAPKSVGVQRRLAGAHPVDVAGDGVDLAVVGEQPQRLGELPAREGVGREARVDDRERALQLGVAQVGVEARQLRRGQHPLVDERARAEARDRERRARLELGDPAGDEQAALELVLVDRRRRRRRPAAGGTRGRRCGRSRRSWRGRPGPRASRAAAGRPRSPPARAAAAAAPTGVGSPERKQLATATLPGSGSCARVIPNSRRASAGSRGGAGSGPRRRRRCSGRRRRRRGARGRRARVSARSMTSWRGCAVEARDAGDAAGVVLVRRVVETGCRGFTRRPIAQARAHPHKFTAERRVGGVLSAPPAQGRSSCSSRSAACSSWKAAALPARLTCRRARPPARRARRPRRRAPRPSRRAPRPGGDGPRPRGRARAPWRRSSPPARGGRPPRPRAAPARSRARLPLRRSCAATSATTTIDGDDDDDDQGG